MFLLPFVAIRMVSGDRQSGALRLELQHGMNRWVRIGVKAAVAMAGWLIAMLPAMSALLLWSLYGGTIYWPEMCALLLGHFLNAGLTIALGMSTASLTEHPSTAAILTLVATIGTWIVNFFGAIQGGWWERAAGYTPAAMVSEAQHGLVRLSTVLVSLLIILAGLALAAAWSRLGNTMQGRVYESMSVCTFAGLAIFASVFVLPNWDLSESRGNSFPAADEQALRQIREPLRVEAHLAAEDPRRADLELQALSKLRRIMPKLQVDYVATTSIGLFEQTRPGYGEIHYYLGNRSTTSRITTADGVLESIYSVAQVTPPNLAGEVVFRGHPLAVQALGAGPWFYLGWPLLTLAAAFLVRRRYI